MKITKNNEVDLLILVNADNALPEDYNPKLATQGVDVAEIMVEEIQEMRQTAKGFGIYLMFNDAYRSRAEQEATYKKIGSKLAAKPGHSEHETGLAIDFSADKLTQKEKQKMWDWLANNAHKYGFILRYPKDKTHITGIDYEPWHYRYVGKEHAKLIYENGLVLEEYIDMLK